MRVYRWDLDKTYLETDFESWRGLVRSATEPPEAKRAVPGAAPLLRAIGSDPSARIHIVSGSPEQMRSRLEQKLRLDGLRWDSFILKDSLHHLKKGQLRAIRGQFGYKLPALLDSRAGLGPAVSEVLFGDDAEVDALVYSVYADLLSGALGPSDASRIMLAAGAYPDRIEQTVGLIGRVAVADAVERIFIRVEKGRPAEDFAPLGPRVVPVRSWWQAAVVLREAGRISSEQAREVLAECMKRSWLDPTAVGGLLAELVARGAVLPETLDHLDLEAELHRACAAALEGLRPTPLERRPTARDYISMVQSWSHKALPGKEGR